mmetsp:Transcript_82224/g.145276  ORF Transcript_82224/g.145276 Transcript_82224/m.145276 type:complete len:81 (+) Transcript_82224:423-665(+)
MLSHTWWNRAEHDVFRVIAFLCVINHSKILKFLLMILTACKYTIATYFSAMNDTAQDTSPEIGIESVIRGNGQSAPIPQA